MVDQVELVERVAAAIETSLDLSHGLKIDMRNDGEFTKAACAAFEASHLVELVDALAGLAHALDAAHPTMTRQTNVGKAAHKARTVLAKIDPHPNNTGRV